MITPEFARLCQVQPDACSRRVGDIALQHDRLVVQAALCVAADPPHERRRLLPGFKGNRYKQAMRIQSDFTPAWPGKSRI
jgi:hypothetical protein